ncbi:MAG: helix-turn-helix domain-containing protein [Lachnospiraceae bacterium]|nr:helix-turn-helix domain-containing protein [Lachnospiraceae bacterium]
MYERFAELLNERGKRPSDLTEATGISSTVFSEWKSGKSQPKVDKLVKIARYLGTSVEYLVTGEDPAQLPQVVLSSDEEDLLASYRKLNRTGKEKAADYISDLKDNDKYIKDSPAPLKKEKIS